MNTDVFFERLKEDSFLIYEIKKLGHKNWDLLSVDDRTKIYISIFTRLANLFPEFGTYKFMFYRAESTNYGNSDDSCCFLNAVALEGDDSFSLLATFIHELRHFYQYGAVKLYDKEKIVHPLFDNDTFFKIRENGINSPLYLGSNYVEASEVNYYTYLLQPMEIDAEFFSYDVMKRLSKFAFTDIVDIVACECSNGENMENYKELENNKNNFFNFSSIYEYKYLDQAKDNKSYFLTDKRRYDHILETCKDIEHLDLKHVLMLLTPCLFIDSSDEHRERVIKRLLEIFGCNGLNFKSKGTVVELNGKEYLVNNSFEVYDELFSFIAGNKLKEIYYGGKEKARCKMERDIVTNLVNEKNIITKDKNPLLYRVQPYVLYKGNYIYNMFIYLMSCIDEVYERKYNYFTDMEKYLRKYDCDSIMKKVEILTGDSFNEFYNKMVSKMENNLEEENSRR